MRSMTQHWQKFIRSFYGLLLITLTTATSGCEATEAHSVEPPTQQSQVVITASARPAIEPVVRYQEFTFAGAKSLTELKSKFGEDGLKLLLKLNRTDLGHLRKGSKLIMPDSLMASDAKIDLLAVSPMPLELEMA